MAFGITVKSERLKFGAFEASTSLSAANGKSSACIGDMQSSTDEPADLGYDDVRVWATVRINGDFVRLLVVRDVGCLGNVLRQ